ncbi:MAG: hypothetical protein HGA78_11290 [Nitrospirales bacterium]|nr:hypothetical protein [Nitrospirales bacterium]
MNDGKKSSGLQRNIAGEAQPKISRSGGPPSDKRETDTDAETDVSRKEAFQGKGRMKQLSDSPSHNPFPQGREIENLHSSLEGEGKGDGELRLLNEFIGSAAQDSFVSDETSMESAPTTDDGWKMFVHKGRKDVDHDEITDLSIPRLSRDKLAAAEPVVPPPQVVIGSIEVVVEMAPAAQTSRPAAQFSRDPGRYYLRRL